MNFLELIKKRQSCRKYIPGIIKKEKIDRCIEAARLAPSACNSQPWRFIVVSTPEIKDNLAENAFSGIYKMNAFAKQASALIVVVRERSYFSAKLGAFFRGVQYSLIDQGIACEHLILQAEEEGLATCWIGWFNEKAVKKDLCIPTGKKIDTIISIGFAENPELRNKSRKDILEISEFR
ncbi:MAG: nitroreductase family protein [Candidatus Omnitrophica bacterium]|nr:nitroreductase family protein [Candidatus Omnitrophota bacterium]MBU1996502.1 nitroreductase family protein [Candidatus Omnitrophota bacterium]MBU4333866.1 nitroreductase family protein [Candidatus Omnitrophota bacterium]